MLEERKIHSILKSRPTTEGAGVKLKRVFGQVHPKLDPFLLLDDFHSDNPDDYLMGFPWHPHRGIETITYMLHGSVNHEDSLGNSGAIGPGDVQWMTAGSGIIHQEMPQRAEGLMGGFQLWANLPSSHKMMNPRYREVKNKDIPEVEIDGSKIKIISGEINEIKGPVQDIITDPEYLDVTVNPNSEFFHKIEKGRNAFAYVFQGKGFFNLERNPLLEEDSLVIFEDGDIVKVSTEESTVRFLLISGKPIDEPVEWGGPIVMNTKEELRTAFTEYRNGTFIKYTG